MVYRYANRLSDLLITATSKWSICLRLRLFKDGDDYRKGYEISGKRQQFVFVRTMWDWENGFVTVNAI